MKRLFILIMIFGVFAVPLFADSQVRITGNLATDFVERPSVSDVVDTFKNKDQPFFWGFGWEVIFDKVGIGGMYDTNFYEDHEEKWWLDWLTQPIYLSYHLFRVRALVDPYVEIGLGCAGRVFLDQELVVEKDPLYLSIFPAVSAGLGLNLNGLILGSKLTYIPTILSLPVSGMDDYPLEQFHVSVYAGVALGSHR